MIRKTTGLDLHRYRQEPDPLGWFREIGIKTVMDIGANTGQFANEIREILPDVFIYSFEPLKDCYEALSKSHVNDKKFKAYNMALGNQNGKTTIHRSSYSPSSSLRTMADNHKRLYPHTAGSTDEIIEIRRLDDINELNPAKLEKEILVKMDVQGFEDKVIDGGKKFLENVKVVMTEISFIPLYDGQPLFANIYKMLTDLGFKYAGSIHQKREKKNGRMIAEDALFERV